MHHGFWDYVLLIYHGIYCLCWTGNTIAYNGQEHRQFHFCVFVLRKSLSDIFKLNKKDLNF